MNYAIENQIKINFSSLRARICNLRRLALNPAPINTKKIRPLPVSGGHIYKISFIFTSEQC